MSKDDPWAPSHATKSDTQRGKSETQTHSSGWEQTPIITETANNWGVQSTHKSTGTWWE